MPERDGNGVRETSAMKLIDRFISRALLVNVAFARDLFALEENYPTSVAREHRPAAVLPAGPPPMIATS
jgi:hypothetical protein